MSLATQIVDALDQFVGHEFSARDVQRRFANHPKPRVNTALHDLYVADKIQRRIRYGVHYYRSRK